MTRLFSHKNRPVHLGSYPLERLARQQNPTRFRRETPPLELQIEDADNPHSLANGMREYVNVMDRMRAGPVAPSQAPIPTDLQERGNHLKAACYYLDASMAGVCCIPESALLEEPVVNHSLTQAMEREYGTGSADNPMAEISVREGRAAWEQAQSALQEPLAHTHALVILVEFPRDARPDEPGAQWLLGSQASRAALRAAEVGAVMANYLRMLGYDARLHTRTASELDIDHLL
ncbi:MAG: NAD-binding oxidoreductase, partial [Haliea sp.]|nr:NAD-binding oxidoreductase [Haliea sp.]